MSPWSMPRDVAATWLTLLCTVAALAVGIALALGSRLGKPPRAGRDRCRLFLYVTALLALAWASAIAYYRPRTHACQQVWARPLAGGSFAVCMINFAPASAAVLCDRKCFQAMGFGDGAKVRDLVERADLTRARYELGRVLRGDGGSAIFRLEPTEPLSADEA